MVLISDPPDVYHRISMRDCAPAAGGKMDAQLQYSEPGVTATRVVMPT
jgi:hypothetical protein